jgi:hypothetical protein
LLGALLLIALTLSIALVPAFLYFLILFIAAIPYLVLYVSASFVIVVLIAWVAGAALYGLLVFMRKIGELGREGSHQDELRPHSLRPVV